MSSGFARCSRKLETKIPSKYALGSSTSRMSAKMAFTIGSRWCSGNSTASTSHRSGAGTR